MPRRGPAARDLRRGQGHGGARRIRNGGPPETIVVAPGCAATAAHGRRSRLYPAISPADVVRAHRRRPRPHSGVARLDSPQGPWAQLDETDLAFLRRLLGALRRRPADRRHPAAGGATEASSAARSTSPLYGQLTRVRLAADLAHQPTAVTVTGWNAEDGSAVKGEASASPTQAPAGARAAWPGRRKCSARAASTSPGPRSSPSTRRARWPRRHWTSGPGASSAPRAWPWAMHSCAWAAAFRLAGVSAQFDNTYYVVRACHLYDMKQGYVTEFGAECAYLGSEHHEARVRPSAGLGPVRPPGRVLSLDDPDQRNRVQVRLLPFNDVAQQDAPLGARGGARSPVRTAAPSSCRTWTTKCWWSSRRATPRDPLSSVACGAAANAPASIEGGQNRYKRIKSKNGIVITLDDQSGQETLTAGNAGWLQAHAEGRPGRGYAGGQQRQQREAGSSGITVQASAKVTCRPRRWT